MLKKINSSLKPNPLPWSNKQLRTSRIRRWIFDEIGVLGAVVLISIILHFGSPYFLTITNLLRVGRQMSFIGLLAIGMSFVIASGQIDISVGRVITLVSFFMAALIKWYGVDPWLAFILGIGLGGLCGLINGGLSLLFKVHPMIITLGTMNLYWGLAVGLSNANPIVLETQSSFFLLGQGKILGVPAPLLVFLFMGLVFHIVMKKTSFGRHVFAVGTNPQAAQYAGIREKWIRLSSMILMGLIAGITGGLVLAFFQSFDPNVGAGMEMSTIGASVIGGADLMGGYASVIGAILGTILIGLLNNGLVLIGVGAYWNNFVTGAVILFAIGVSYLLRLLRK
jgi:ribose/xylose/arabinose/galactoside ABC-type transport system permease subunit